MTEKICLLCGGEDCASFPCDEKNCKGYYCKTYDRHFKLHTTVLDSQEKEKLLDLITEFLLHNQTWCNDCEKQDYVFYYRKEPMDCEPWYVNTYDLVNSYPTEFMDKAVRALMNLSVYYPEYGYVFLKTPYLYRALFDIKGETPASYTGGMYRMLCELGYLTSNESGYIISAEGWKKIDELKRNSNTVNQGFVAMHFCEGTEFIREAFRKAITNSRYAAIIIDEKEHNNQIVPEIFYEIKRSKFVVVDVTYPNYGAYYEAGYAQALGKQVIMCCRKSEFDGDDTRPHFDVAQKSMIIWNDEDDLIMRLQKRIKATVK